MKSIPRLFLLLFILGLAGLTTLAATPQTTAPFTGTFYGRVTGDQGSSAPLVLRLTQTGDVVEGQVFVGRGLVVDGRNCGVVDVPAGVQYATGQVQRQNPRQLTATVPLNVDGLKVNIQLTGRLSANGQTLATEARIDLPWLCGRDPLLSGTLTSQ